MKSISQLVKILGASDIVNRLFVKYFDLEQIRELTSK